jgi:hypothetical protein
MAEPWSELEVQATVADYFSMLWCQLRGEKYSKAEHRRTLLPLLRNRSESSIERKHQNISAILRELDLPHLVGYVPLYNYQLLLKTVILDWLTHTERTNQLADFADDPAPAPTVPKKFSELQVDIPKPLPKPTPTAEDLVRVGRRIDYARREAANRSLGRQGEEFALSWEQERLRYYGRDDLAQKVEWVSEVQGDGLGFDIASFDPETEQPIAIEVKTTRGGQYNPFFVTRNEAEVSREQGNKYRLYRLFSFAIDPRLFIVPGPLDTALILEPYTYRAYLRP